MSAVGTSEWASLGRTFTEVTPDAEEPEVSVEYYLRRSGHATAQDWGWLLASPLVIILNEAGAGKTGEIRHRVEELRKSDASAFFLRLERLYAVKGDAAFDAPEDVANFHAWVRGRKSATFFLDALDEAKLPASPDSNPLQSALRNLEEMVGQAALSRLRLVISSRPSAWYTGAELAETERLAKRFKSLGLKGDNGAPLERVVRLDPLDHRQQADLAAFVEAPASFMADLARSGMADLATTPLDLIDFVTAYKAEVVAGREGAAVFESLSTILDRSITARAADFGASSQRSLLPPQRVRAGARRLACACLLGQTLSIRKPGSTGDGVAPVAALSGLDPQWSPQEIDQLLSCGLFSSAWVGAVRFSHRRRLDRLAAEGFHDLLEAGMEVKALAEHLLPESYGEVIVPKAFEEAIGWLATLNVNFRQHLLKVAPHLLLELGDPAQLPIPTREAALRGHVGRYVEVRRRGEWMVRTAMRRLAHPLLEAVCNEILTSDAPDEPIEHILVLVQEGRLAGCLEPALAIAEDPTRNAELRAHAIDSVVAIGDTAALERLKAAALAMKAPDAFTDTHTRHYYNTLLLAFVIACAPKVMSLREALRVLYRLVERQRSYGYVPELALVGALSRQCPTQDLERARRLLSCLCWRDRPGRLTTWDHPIWTHLGWYLLPVLEDICARCIVERPADLRVDALLHDITRLFAAGEVAMGPLRHRDASQPDAFEQAFAKTTWVREAMFNAALAEVGDDHLYEPGHLLDRLRRRQSHLDRPAVVVQDLDWILRDYAAATESRRRDAIRNAFDDRLHNLDRADRKAWEARLRRLGEALGDPLIRRRFRPTPVERLQDLNVRIRRFWRRQRFPSAHARREAIDEWRFRLKLWRETRAIERGERSGLAYHAIRLHLHGPEPFASVREAYGDRIGLAVLRATTLHAQSFVPTLGFSRQSQATRLAGLGWSQIAIDTPDRLASLDRSQAKNALVVALSDGSLPSWAEPLLQAHPDLWLDLMEAPVRGDLAPWRRTDDAYYGGALSLVARQDEARRADLAAVALSELSKPGPFHVRQIQDGALIALSAPATAPAMTRLAERRAREALANGEMAQAAAWVGAWARVDARAAWTCIQRFRDLLWGAAGDDLMQQLIVALSQHIFTPSIEPDVLAIMAVDMMRHIRIDEDSELNGEVTGRHNAQELRTGLVSILSNNTTSAARAALQDLLGAPEFADYADWIRRQLREQAALAVKPRAWPTAAFAEFFAAWQKRPTTAGELHDLVVRQLTAIVHDLATSEFDLRGLFKKPRETEVRAFLGRALKARSMNWFGVTQETVTAGENRTDLRIEGRSHRDEIVVVELKLAGNWTGDVLMQKLEEQLLDQYLISRKVRHGIYLVVDLGKTTPWTLEGRSVSFEALTQALQERAAVLQDASDHVDRIEVLALSILQPKPKSAKAKATEKAP